MRAEVAYRLRRIADKIAPAPTLVTRTPTIGELDDVWRYVERAKVPSLAERELILGIR